MPPNKEHREQLAAESGNAVNSLSAVGRILSGQVSVIWVPAGDEREWLGITGPTGNKGYAVAQLRHRFTEYDVALAELGGVPRSHPIYRDIRNRVLQAIAKRYPEYAKAAKQQMLQAHNPSETSFLDAMKHPMVTEVGRLNFEALWEFTIALTPMHHAALKLLAEGYAPTEIGSNLKLKKAKLIEIFQQIQDAVKNVQGVRRV